MTVKDDPIEGKLPEESYDDSLVVNFHLMQQDDKS